MARASYGVATHLRSSTRVASLLAFLLLLAALALAVPGLAAARSLLIVAPHPDDDLLYGAGVAAAAHARGDIVKVLYMTNGDLDGVAKGLQRQDEAVAGQAHIGSTDEDDLIFLGYPDTGLWDIYHVYTGSGSALLGVNGRMSTYGNRGIGKADGPGNADYHYYRFGSHGAYNAPSVLADLQAILTEYRPEDVYTTGPDDLHSDHSITYEFVKQALLDRMAADCTYQATLHTTMVHSSDPMHWPLPLDPQTSMTKPPGMSDGEWSQRESFPVPAAMQSTNEATNPKILALDEHASQGGAGDYLGQFVHSDEVFWIEFQRDDTAPDGTFWIGAGNPRYTPTRAMTLVSSIQDDSPPIEMRFRNSGDAWPVGGGEGWEPYAASKSWTLSAGDGPKTVDGQFKDGAGNVATLTATITLDATLPAGTFAIANGAAYSAVFAVTLDSAISDATALEMRFRNSGEAWPGSWEPYAASKSWTLISGDGLKTVDAQFRDAAGNIFSTSDQITVDATLPNGGMTVNGGAAYTNSTAVTLANAVSNAVEMRFSNDGAAWGAWEPYAAGKSWTLAASDGAKTVRGEFRNHTGGVYSVVAIIVLDGTAPTVADDAPDAWQRAAVTVHLSAADGGSGFERTQYRAQGSATWLDAAGDAFVVSGNVAQSYEYRALDKAGNASATGTCIVRIDSAKPAPKAATKASVRRGSKATLKFRVNDSWPKSGTATVTLKIRSKQGKTVKTVVLKDRAVNTALSYSFKCTFKKGTYRFSVSAKDAAGNQSKTASNLLVVK